MREGKMEQEIVRLIVATSVVMRTLHQSVVKKQLSHKGPKTVYVLILTCGDKLWVRMQLQIHVAIMSFLHGLAGVGLRHRVELLLLCIERGQIR